MIDLRDEDVLALWRAEPSLMVRTLFGAEPDPWQTAGLRDFASNDPKHTRCAYQACVGVGKDALLAWCGWNHLVCYSTPTEYAQGACVAPTDTQLHDTLWKEYARWYSHPNAGWLRDRFTMTSDRIASREFPMSCFISARSYPKDADNETLGRTLSGLHAPFMLVQFTESATMPASLVRTAEQARSGAKRFKFQQVYNPIARDGAAWVAAATERDRWNLTIVTGDPDDPGRSSRIPVEMALEEIATKGRDDPWVMAHILGKFPPGGLNTLIEPHEVEEAMRRAPRKEDFDFAAKVLGCDVGRQGLDPSVVAQRQGKMIFPLYVRHGIDGREGSGVVARLWQDWGADGCFIDDTGGFGGSWLDHLRGLNFAPIGIHFAGEPIDRRYLNKRAEMIFEFVKWIKAGGALPPEDKLLAKELCALRYMHKGDRLKIEEKDEIRKRLGFSTDRVDACALTFAHPLVKSNPGPEDILMARFTSRPQVAVMDVPGDFA